MSGGIERGRGLRGAQQLEADVVIVGSGASGAVVAAELAEAGQDVLVLEEGPHVPPEAYQRMRPSQSMRGLWRDGALTAAIGVGDTPIINVTMGRCVGGSSVLTGGVCFRAPGSVLARWVNERGLRDLNEVALAPFFERVENVIHVETVPTELRSRSTQLWAEGAARLGVQVKPTRRNTRGCRGAGTCNFGCPVGAKLGVDVTYLPMATAAGARVLSDCRIDRILVEGDRAVGVRGRLLNGADGRPGDRITVRARRVVLAAGAAHTPLMLMRSGIGRRSAQVGRNMTLHPSFRILARFDERVDGWRGALQSAYSDAYEDERITMMSVFVPPAVIIAALPGFGPDFTERAAMLPHLAMFGALIHDEAGGRVRRGPGSEPLLTYRMNPLDRATIPRVVRRLGEAYLAAGARELFVPILGHPPVTPDEFRKLDLERVPASRYECSSQHPLGTCRMGDKPETSVVDSLGRAWDVRELYVVDGSVLPTSLGVNPQLTIMAMALRLASRMLDAPLAPR